MPTQVPANVNNHAKTKKIIFHDVGEQKQGDKFKQKNKKQQRQQAFANGNANKEAANKKNSNNNAYTPKKIVFKDNYDVEIIPQKNAKKNETTVQTTTSNKVQKAKKIVFTDEDEEAVETIEPKSEIEDDYFTKREQQRKQKQNKHTDDDDAQKKWYHVYPEYPCNEELLDMKESEQLELYNLCKNAYNAERAVFNKRNTSDARWLHTALHKGTAKDRANAGALLVTNNPLGNLEALNTLISFCKQSNKFCVDVIGILTDLWKEVLLPSKRKLLSLQMRAADFRHLRKDATLTKEQQKRIYAYWYFEHELKDNYFEFLKNIMQCLQTGQENQKTNAIVSASKLLVYAPEKEQMLLTMLINKLGDPLPKIASKALHHLTEVAYRHPNMCAVIVNEAEKLLFRNNISDRAQHFTLCFLASIAPSSNSDVCTKLVHICFSLFKVLVQKGAINNRIMQAILRCLQKGILEAKPIKGRNEILDKEMQDTIYRLVHLADINVSVQTLGLLLQLITVKTEKSDRFYNALYVKLMDLNLINIGAKTAAQFLHIVHRAVHFDKHVARSQAFLKRLLQLSLHTPAHFSAGCMIVIHKLLCTKPELIIHNPAKEININNEVLAKFDSDGDEKYVDVVEQTLNSTVETTEVDVAHENQSTTSSWHHTKVNETKTEEKKTRDFMASKYNAYHRVPAYAGAELAWLNELHLLRQHYHPSVQVFAENILNEKRIDYYGDPLRDFSLPHFLERFAFKNPKKFDQDKTEMPVLVQKHYKAFGTRGKPIKTLTKNSCTEDEMYILNFLEQKRQKAFAVGKKQLVKKSKITDDDENEDFTDELQPGEVNDDEFEEYLDGYFGKRAKNQEDADATFADADDLDFLQELGGELKTGDKIKRKNRKEKKMGSEDELDNDIDADWGDEDEAASDDDEDSIDFDNNADGDVDDDTDDDDEEGFISLDETMTDHESDAESDEQATESTDEEGMNMEQKKKKAKKRSMSMKLDERGFTKKLKQSQNMSSLFAAADDFADLLEETGKTKGHGTINAIFNKDKSSDKQLKWEEKRRSNAKQYKSRKLRGNSKLVKKKFDKKHKY